MNKYGLMRNDSGEMIALKGVEVVSRIAGILAQTELTQQYRNDTPENLELAYTFPLPVGATLLSFEVSLGARRFVGEVIPRRQAEADYEAAIAQGDAAFRLQEIRPGMYNATLGNVLPGESVEITLSYAETLAWNGQAIRYRLPTTIAPRYGEPTKMQPWQRPVTSLMPEYPLALSLQVSGSLTQGSISCPSHAVVFKQGEASLEISLAKGASLDRDFILEIHNDAVQSLGVAASARDTHVALLTLLPPAVAQPQTDRDTVFVIDCSGSMQGDSLALAKEGLAFSLHSLNPGERFGIVAFGTRAIQFDSSLQPANRKNLDIARCWVDQLGDLGGTELEQALALALALHDGQPMDILLLTDGQAWNLGGIIAQAQAQNVRIFTIGIGSAVAEETVHSLAIETGGACELLAPNEDMAERIYRHFARMRQPKVEHVAIHWPVDPLWECRPSGACFAGDAYTVAAAFATPLTSQVSVTFQCSDSAPIARLDVPMGQPEEIADALVRVAARQRLVQLKDEEKQGWAVQFQLITDETDYLIQVERAAEEKPAAGPELQVIPQMLPAGWGGTSHVGQGRLSEPLRAASVKMSPALAYSSSSSMDHVSLEIPAVIRSGVRRSIHSSESSGANLSAYSTFIKTLNAHANRWWFGSLPVSIAQLRTLPLPDLLENLLDELIQEGITEEELVLAFYQAVLSYQGPSPVSNKCRKQITKWIGNRLANSSLAGRWSSSFAQLASQQVVVPDFDRYDIPAFLKRQVD